MSHTGPRTTASHTAMGISYTHSPARKRVRGPYDSHALLQRNRVTLLLAVLGQSLAVILERVLQPDLTMYAGPV